MKNTTAIILVIGTFSFGWGMRGWISPEAMDRISFGHSAVNLQKKEVAYPLRNKKIGTTSPAARVDEKAPSDRRETTPVAVEINRPAKKESLPTATSSLADLNKEDWTTLKALVNLSGTERIHEMLGEHLGIEVKDIPESTPARALARRLIEVAIEHHAAFDTSSGETPSYDTEKVLFASSVREDFSPLHATAGFATRDMRIYGSFQTSEAMADEGKVLVKWYRLSDGEILLMKYLTIVPGKPWNYVWICQGEGWQAGQYRAKVFSLRDDVRCLAEGTFEVAAPEETFSTSSLEFSSQVDSDGVPQDILEVLNTKSDGRSYVCSRVTASAYADFFLDFLLGDTFLERRHASSESSEGFLQVLVDPSLLGAVRGKDYLYVRLYKDDHLQETAKILVTKGG
jgi:hypothetical protein